VVGGVFGESPGPVSAALKPGGDTEWATGGGRVKSGVRYFALATDYDGTLAHDGRVDDATIAALERARASGRRLVLVTGRELEDLQTVFDRFDLFDICVLENGALLYWPKTRAERVLAERPPNRFMEMLRARGLDRVSQGRVIVATWHPHENTVLSCIRDLGLELEVIFNKDAVMVLPTGVNKATGLVAALKELGLSPRNCVGVGDAENDHAFLAICECSVAVSNSVPMLKERADIVTEGHHGAGVVELIEEMLADDLAGRDASLMRQRVLIGHRLDGRQVRIPQLHNLAFLGPADAARTRAAAGFLERLMDGGYQCCVIDPRGEFDDLEQVTSIGTAERPPPIEDVLDLLRKPEQQVAVELSGAKSGEKTGYFTRLLGALIDKRRRTGRPHWILIDDAHELVPEATERIGELLASQPSGLLLMTSDADKVARPMLSLVRSVLALGAGAADLQRSFGRLVESPLPSMPRAAPYQGEALMWERAERHAFLMRTLAPREEARRPQRKRIEADLDEAHSFYFRGPGDRMNIRAQNLNLFLQIGMGVDEETWEYHRRRGDFSRWLRESVRNERAAEAVALVERMPEIDARRSRELVRDALNGSAAAVH
jgi:HAD superfamily hydrolase (TIGR01484 family)